MLKFEDVQVIIVIDTFNRENEIPYNTYKLKYLQESKFVIDVQQKEMSKRIKEKTKMLNKKVIQSKQEVQSQHYQFNKRRIINVLFITFVLLPIIIFSPYLIEKDNIKLKNLEVEYKTLLSNSFSVKESDYRRYDDNIYVKVEIVTEFLGKEPEQPLVRFRDTDYIKMNKVKMDQFVNEEISYVCREMDNKVYLVSKEKFLVLNYGLTKLQYEGRITLTKMLNVMALLGYLWVICTSLIPMIIYFAFPRLYNKYQNNVLFSYYENR